jgi:alpha-glucoside transport system substrate-binding protein
MRPLRSFVLPVLLALLAGACVAEEGGDGDGDGAQDPNTGRVNVLFAGEPEEAEAIQAIFDDLINSETEYTAEVEASGNLEEQVQIRAQGGTLDVVLLPQPGTVADLAAAGNIVSLEDLGWQESELSGLFGDYFPSLGEFEGEHYGLPTNINLKSMVWYPADDFEEAGYEIPQTFDELMALSDQIVQDGGTPWCVGYQSEGSTGWPATDWMEDIMLGTAGTETYDQWVSHEIPFDDPAVQEAGEIFGQVMFTEGYVLGGAENTPSVAFDEAPAPMFEEPDPGCWLHRQASFINAFFPEDAEAGVDYDWFPFPPIDQEGTLFAGELAVVGRNAPEVQDFLRRFSDQEVQCAMGGTTASSRISPNVNVGADCYANEILADASTVLTTALEEGTGRFDASDLMPPEVGSGSFWTGMVDYMQQGPDALPAVLGEIESSWPQE